MLDMKKSPKLNISPEYVLMCIANITDDTDPSIYRLLLRSNESVQVVTTPYKVHLIHISDTMQ